MKVSLDSNICIALISNRSQAARLRLLSHDAGDIVMSAVVYFELLYGAAKSGRPSNFGALQDFKASVSVIAVEEDDAAEAGRIRSTLEAAGKPIGPYDLLIAGQAKARGLVLATNNVREFSRVSGLVIEDWLA